MCVEERSAYVMIQTFSPAPNCVAAEKPQTVLHGEVVLLCVHGRHYAPIAVLVAGQELGRVLAGTREERERRRHGYHPSEREGAVTTAPCTELRRLRRAAPR